MGSGFLQDRADRNVMHCLLCSTLKHTKTEKKENTLELIIGNGRIRF